MAVSEEMLCLRAHSRDIASERLCLLMCEDNLACIVISSSGWSRNSDLYMTQRPPSAPHASHGW